MNSDDIKFISIGLVSFMVLTVLLYIIPWFVVGAVFLTTMLLLSWAIGFIAYNLCMDVKDSRRKK